MNSFNPHSYLCSGYSHCNYYKGRLWDRGNMRNLPVVTQLGSGRAGVWTSQLGFRINANLIWDYSIWTLLVLYIESRQVPSIYPWQCIGGKQSQVRMVGRQPLPFSLSILPCFLHHRDLLQSSWISFPWQLHLSPVPSCTLKHIHVSIISFLLNLPLLTSSITQCFSVSILKGNLRSASFSPPAIPWFTASLVLGAPTWSSQQWLGKLVSVYGKQGSPRNSEAGEAMQGVCAAGFLRLGLPTTKLK